MQDAADKQTKQTESNIYRSYNYVGTKETVAYILNDFSNSFNLGASNGEKYFLEVVRIDLGINAIAGIFTGVWDVVNDAVISAVVDNTRTRIGKFRPYLLLMQIPLSFLGLLYWTIPFLFPGTNSYYLPKIIFYYVFSVIQETAGTFTGVAKAGYMSTITPNPNERVRLITLAELLSGWLGEDLPSTIMSILVNAAVKGMLHIELRTLFLAGGVFTTVVSSALTFWFFCVSKERVPQSLDRPDLKSGFKAIFGNYPMLLYCLSEFLGGFSVGANEDLYWESVFSKKALVALWKKVASDVSGPVGSISYSYVPALRRRFSSKFLWVGADLYGDALSFGFFFFGMFHKNYKEMKPMLIFYGFREFFSKLKFGVDKVINADLYNEAMDYCEWKNGFRMEATTGVAKDLVLKLQRTVMSSVRSMVLKKIGYSTEKHYYDQDEKTQFWLFALCSVVPVLTGALGVVPKILWPINKQTRAKMYEELAERRNKMVSDYMDTHTEKECGE